MVIEKRRFQRFELSMPADVEYPLDGDRRVEKISLMNVSIGGAQFRSSDCHNVGSKLDLNLYDINSQFRNELGLHVARDEPLNIKIRGEVLRAEEPTGVEEFWRLSVKFNGPVRIIA